MNSELHDRINRIINTEAFERTLEEAGLCLFEFQCEWARYPTFEDMPKAFKAAILAGEKELSGGTITVF